MKPNTMLSVRESPSAVRDVAIRVLMQQVWAEYVEMPGLSLTLPQAQRLWTVDRPTCEEAFRRLIADRVLRRTSSGRFVRA